MPVQHINQVAINDGGGGAPVIDTFDNGGDSILLNSDKTLSVLDILADYKAYVEELKESFEIWDKNQYSEASHSDYGKFLENYPEKSGVENAIAEVMTEIDDAFSDVIMIQEEIDLFSKAPGDIYGTPLGGSSSTPKATTSKYYNQNFEAAAPVIGGAVSSGVVNSSSPGSSTSTTVSTESNDVKTETELENSSNSEQPKAEDIISSQVPNDSGNSNNFIGGSYNAGGIIPNIDGELVSTEQFAEELGLGEVVDSLEYESILGNSTGSILDILSKEDFNNSGASIISNGASILVPSSIKKNGDMSNSGATGSVGVIAAGGTAVLGLGLALIGGLHYYKKKKKKKDEDDSTEQSTNSLEAEVYDDGSMDVLDQQESVLDIKEHLMHLGEDNNEELDFE